VAGAGLSFVLNADLVIAARSTRFVAAYTAVGLTPDCGISYLLPGVIGQRTRIDAARALDWGLIPKVVDDDDLTSRAVTVGRQLAAGPTPAFALTKRLIRSSWSPHFLGATR
jgi:2-(1,2-epoxy-1,2-dihydrophenyl)acetyl-CoA isomerase